MKRTIYTEEQKQEMKDLYISGLSVLEISKRMETDKGTLRRELQSLITLRSKGESQRMAKGIKYVRSDAFDILSPESLYWIGFLYADGSIEKNAPVISLAITADDKDHIQRYNEFLGGCLNIATIQQGISRTLKGQKKFSKPLARIKVADRQLYNRLLSLGFTPNKSLSIIPHELLRTSRDFWRGVVDGDGWITWSNSTVINTSKLSVEYSYPKVGLCGNEATIKEFLRFIELSGIQCKSCIKKSKKANSLYSMDSTGLYSMDSTGQPAIEIMNLLYKESSVSLNRKYQKYQECINTGTKQST